MFHSRTHTHGKCSFLCILTFLAPLPPQKPSLLRRQRRSQQRRYAEPKYRCPGTFTGDSLRAKSAPLVKIISTLPLPSLLHAHVRAPFSTAKRFLLHARTPAAVRKPLQPLSFAPRLPSPLQKLPPSGTPAITYSGRPMSRVGVSIASVPTLRPLN